MDKPTCVMCMYAAKDSTWPETCSNCGNMGGFVMMNDAENEALVDAYLEKIDKKMKSNDNYLTYLEKGSSAYLYKASKFDEEKSNVAEVLAHIGSRYALGHGLPRNERISYKYMAMAADLGDVVACTQMGIAYEEGFGGVPQNEEKAYYYYLKAAEKGQKMAQYQLAYLYVFGSNKNYDEAVKWLIKSAEAGYEPAKEWLEDLKK